MNWPVGIRIRISDARPPSEIGVQRVTQVARLRRGSERIASELCRDRIGARHQETRR